MVSKDSGQLLRSFSLRSEVFASLFIRYIELSEYQQKKTAQEQSSVFMFICFYFAED